jgi:hypothetical protein
MMSMLLSVIFAATAARRLAQFGLTLGIRELRRRRSYANGCRRIGTGFAIEIVGEPGDDEA